MNPFRSLLLLTLLLLVARCEAPRRESETGKLRVLATTGIIADAVRNIAGPHAVVQSLMGPGVDPHLYKPSLRDIEKLTDTDVIFYNGLHLEGKMQEILRKVGRRKTAVAVTERIPADLLLRVENTTAVDPHIWFDVSLWSRCVTRISEVLQERDPAHASDYRRNAAIYLAKLDSLHQYARRQIARIPPSGRVLITAHDAFGYFSRAYGIEVRGLQGISTLSEYGISDVSSLVDFISKRKIKAVFVETSVSPRSIEAVMEGSRAVGHPVQHGGNLYSDALGDPGTPEGTYAGMFKSNVNTIVNGLK